MDKIFLLLQNKHSPVYEVYWWSVKGCSDIVKFTVIHATCALFRQLISQVISGEHLLEIDKSKALEGYFQNI